MTKFNLKIEGKNVDLNGISGGIKRENIKDEKMRSIFNAIENSEGKNKKITNDGVLSDGELKFIFGMVKDRAMKWFNASNLGDKEYKSLLKKFKKQGIDLSQFSKAEFLEFIKTLSDVSNNSAASAAKEEVQIVAGKGSLQQGYEDQEELVEQHESEGESFEPAFRPDKPASIKKVSQPKVWQHSNPTNVQFNNEEDDNADKVLAKLMQAYDIDAEDVQMNELKADLIRYNPSIFDKNGNVYVKPEWSKLDFPKNAEESYAIDAEIPKVEKPVTQKAADGTAAAPEAQKGAKKQGGAEKASKGGKSEPAKTFSVEDIKVTVPQTKQSKYAKLIDGYRNEGEKLHDSLKKGDTTGLTTQNIAYAFTKDIHFGPNSKAQAKKVFSLLYSRMSQLKLLEKGDCTSYERFSKMSFKEQDALLHDYRNRIVLKEREIINTENARVAEANARPARQKVFDEANEVLINAANNAGKLKDDAFWNNEDKKYVRLDLGNGKYIYAFYNDFGKITKVNVGTLEEDGESINYDVSYTAKYAMVDTDISNDKWEGEINSGFDFEKIKEVAQAIFGNRIGTPTPKVIPDEEGKYTPEQVGFEVKYEHYSEGQINRAKQEGEKIRKGELGFDKLNTHNVAYCFGEKDDVAASGAKAKLIFANLRARLQNLGYNSLDEKPLVTNGEFPKMSAEDQNKVIHRYASFIRYIDNKRLSAKDKAKDVANTLYDANERLAQTATNPPETDKIVYSTTKYGTKQAKADIGDGKWIEVSYLDDGNIYSISVGHTSDKGKAVEDASYSSDSVTVGYSRGVDYSANYDFDKIKALANQIFGDWKEPAPVEEPEAEET